MASAALHWAPVTCEARDEPNRAGALANLKTNEMQESEQPPESSPVAWRCGRFAYAPGRALVMGILNLTPDSFSDGGRYPRPHDAIAAAHGMIDDGADILDLGAESTRPGATPPSEAEELDRLLPVLEGLRGAPVALSVDTRRAAVMRAVLAAGADLINDIEALGAPGAYEAVAGSSCGVCLMHMRGSPLTMQQAPAYREVVGEVAGFLQSRLDQARAHGIADERIVLDPGIGFGKDLGHNLALLHSLDRITALGRPVLVGASRKSMLGALTGRAVVDRMAGSIAVALAAASRGARILRVHDVRETVDALRVWNAIEAGKAAQPD